MKTYNEYIDSTLLKPNATLKEITKLFSDAVDHRFKCVCVNPTWVATAVKLLKDSDVKVCTVIGFPLGASTTKTKCYEAMDALNNGASEIDMVINISDLKAHEYDAVLKEISAVKKVCGDYVLKVIAETCLLSIDEKEQICTLAIKAGADFIKTSTGFNGEGATINDVRLFKRIAGDRIGIKASGGIKTKDQMIKLIDAGATRIGTSHATELIK